MGPAFQSNAPGTAPLVAANTCVPPPGACDRDQPIDFGRNQEFAVWKQVYELAVDQKSNRPSATIEFEVTSVVTGKPAIRLPELAHLMGFHGNQMTLKKTLPDANFPPGTYQLRTQVRGEISQHGSEPSPTFTVGEGL